MRRLLLAFAALALLSTPVAAQTISKSQTGEIGSVVTATDTSGASVKAVLPMVTLAGATGTEKGTSANPIYTAAAASSPTLSPVTAGTATATNSSLMGCRYVATTDTFANTNQGAVTCGTRGSLHVEMWGADSTNSLNLAAPNSDAVATTIVALASRSFGYLYDGTNEARARSISGSIGSAGVGVTAVEQAGTPFSHISTNATTTAKSGAGILHKVCVNTKGATANVATIYDNTTGSGTVIGVLDTTSNVGCVTYDAAFATGLTIVTATGTAGDLTVTYR